MTDPKSKRIAERVARLRLAQLPVPIDRVRAAAAAVPYLDDKLLDGAPSCSAADFKTPRLRKCPFDLTTIDWNFSSRIDGGLDGYLWKVWFGEDGPYVLKVFWDTAPPEFTHYFSAQRECQNAAIFQMMEAAVQEAAIGLSPPPLVNANPRTKDEAKANIYAFSTEVRQMKSPSDKTSETMEISSIPRLKKCYGWLTLSGQLFRGLHRSLKPPALHVGKIKRSMSADKDYTAIVYEYVEEGENPPDVVEEVADFFWLAGFSHILSPAARNWKRGVLVDLSDIVHAGGYGWHVKSYGPRKANRILVP